LEVDEALETRRSVRGFQSRPVSRATLEHILRVACRAPSGTNMQPWRVFAVAGETKAAITRDALALHDGGSELREPEYPYYPEEFPPEYKARRREVGWAMYGLIGIGRGDHEKMHRQHAENFRFFGAPVGLFFFVDRALEIGSWLDHGMFVQSVMIAARAQGLHTCPQAAWPPFHKAVRRHLPVGDDEVLVCGMAIGWEDEDAPINGLRTKRRPVEEFATFVDFDDSGDS
jgi:nitroreductase